MFSRLRDFAASRERGASFNPDCDEHAAPASEGQTISGLQRRVVELESLYEQARQDTFLATEHLAAKNAELRSERDAWLDAFIRQQTRARAAQAALSRPMQALAVAIETLRSFDEGDQSTETGWKHDELFDAWVQCQAAHNALAALSQPAPGRKEGQ